jgi:immune inhibitor A
VKNKLLIITVILAIVLASLVTTAVAGPTEPQTTLKLDNRPDPLTTQQLALREKALEASLHGKTNGNILEVKRGEYVELEREGEGVLWTVLGEFSDLKHNQIPEPDRTEDNTTIWVTDFNRDYYLDILFNGDPGANSMRNYYIEQSSNRYTVHGDVTDWVAVSGEAATYDDDLESPLGGNAVWYFLLESVNAWYDAQVAAGKTPAEINAYLSEFDVWDRYDYDGDGDFDEPDGYIDTFQSVFAGTGNDSCSKPTCDWQIWPHSWYAFPCIVCTTGPTINMMGGIPIGESEYWVGKYTIQPENGGVGVFAHEYGHDLGLPDLYDYYGSNSTGFWTLMSSGSWLDEGLDTIGNKPSHMGAWEKLQLGWLNYDLTNAGETSEHFLGPMEYNTDLAQGLVIVLPPKTVTGYVGDPYAGEYFYYSGMGADLDNSMTRVVTLPAEGATLDAKVNYAIELDWDYAYLTVNDMPVETNLSTTSNPNFQNLGYGITGFSDGWVDLTADLSAFAGQEVTLGFRYWTDGFVNESGFLVDEIAITGLGTDGGEVEPGWDYQGFIRTTGSETNTYEHYYVAEYRTYQGYDSTLKVGPYVFGYPDLYNYVDHFAYQDGLLINYWDTEQKDNNTGNHPGHGLCLPIDAHYETMYIQGHYPWQARVQTYDSTFTIAPTDGIPDLHWRGLLKPVPSLPGVRTFDDRILHYDPANPLLSVIHPNTGTLIHIKSINTMHNYMQVTVQPAE